MVSFYRARNTFGMALGHFNGSVTLLKHMQLIWNVYLYCDSNSSRQLCRACVFSSQLGLEQRTEQQPRRAFPLRSNNLAMEQLRIALPLLSGATDGSTEHCSMEPSFCAVVCSGCTTTARNNNSAGPLLCAVMLVKDGVGANVEQAEMSGCYVHAVLTILMLQVTLSEKEVGGDAVSSLTFVYAVCHASVVNSSLQSLISVCLCLPVCLQAGMFINLTCLLISR